jgi:hypothetical protein
MLGIGELVASNEGPAPTIGTARTAKVTATGLTGGDGKQHHLTLAIAFFLAGKPFLAGGDTR